MRGQVKKWFNKDFLLFLLGFLLFWEWLRPLETVTDTGSLESFVLYTAFCFAISYFQRPIIVSFLLKGTAMFYILNSLFYTEPFLRFKWIALIREEVRVNISVISVSQWWEMSALFRSFLFLILLWLISYLMYYWIIQVKKVFLFLVFTVIYITVLDTFTEYDAKFAIIRTVLIGFFILGTLQYGRIKERESFSQNHQRFLYWIIPLFIMIISSVSLGYVAPKAAPQWADPVPYLTSMSESAREETRVGIQKVGYGTNDSQLGGAFMMDETPVFQALVQKVHYWRIESKDLYTGKGWEVSEYGEPIPFNPTSTPYEYDISTQLYDKGVNVTPLEAFVQFNQENEYSHIVYPIDLKAITTSEDVNFTLQPATQKISVLKEGQPEKLGTYRLRYHYPEFSVTALKDSSEEDSERISEQYTQLPPSLPERVQRLAEQITEGKETRFEKVKTIEKYFGAAGYVYETSDVPVPKGDEDYVDQFLFESKRGYCDNYSSSMVVMLRTLNIPARWVKGYTQGEYMETIKASTRLYEIRNENAHSWVEVYFPEVGWVPFEPTRGFLSPFDFEYERQEDQNNSVPYIPNMDEKEKKLEEEKDEEVPLRSRFSITFPELSWKALGIGSSIMGITIAISFMTRRKWMTALIVYRFRLRKDQNVYSDAYRILLKQLTKSGYKKEEGQTLREYAAYVDKQFGMSDMKNMTAKYEKYLYRGEHGNASWIESKELWENLIKRLSS